MAVDDTQRNGVFFTVDGESHYVPFGGIIGRSAHAWLRLENSDVSEAHALVSLRDGKPMLLGLGGLLRRHDQTECASKMMLERDYEYCLGTGPRAVRLVCESVHTETNALELELHLARAGRVSHTLRPNSAERYGIWLSLADFVGRPDATPFNRLVVADEADPTDDATRPGWQRAFLLTRKEQTYRLTRWSTPSGVGSAGDDSEREALVVAKKPSDGWWQARPVSQGLGVTVGGHSLFLQPTLQVWSKGETRPTETPPPQVLTLHTWPNKVVVRDEYGQGEAEHSYASGPLGRPAQFVILAVLATYGNAATTEHYLMHSKGRGNTERGLKQVVEVLKKLNQYHYNASGKVVQFRVERTGDGRLVLNPPFRIKNEGGTPILYHAESGGSE